MSIKMLEKHTLPSEIKLKLEQNILFNISIPKIYALPPTVKF